MIVIKESNRKLLELNEILKEKRNDDVMIIDLEDGIVRHLPYGYSYLTIGKDVEELLNLFPIIHTKSKTNCYIFYVGTYESNQQRIKDIESEYDVEIILVVEPHVN